MKNLPNFLVFPVDRSLGSKVYVCSNLSHVREKKTHQHLNFSLLVKKTKNKIEKVRETISFFNYFKSRNNSDLFADLTSDSTRQQQRPKQVRITRCIRLDLNLLHAFENASFYNF